MKHIKNILGGALIAFAAFGFAFLPVTSAHSLALKNDAETHANGKFTAAQVKADAQARASFRANLNAALKSIANRFPWRTNWENSFQLTNTLDNGMTVSGKGHVTMKKNMLYDVTVKLHLTNFPASTTAASAYEVWLVADSAAASPVATSNYQLSLGAVTPGNKNSADLSFSTTMINPKIYNRLVVTQEPLNDMDPRPGTAVFSATIDSLIFREVSMKTTLMSKNEVPANDSQASGAGYFIINTKNNTLTYKLSFNGLSGAETGAHIHGPARPGANAGVLFTLPMGNTISGVWHYDESIESSILHGQTYVNVHSEKYPDGEIRGQIVF